jgi:hypothetical protein
MNISCRILLFFTVNLFNPGSENEWNKKLGQFLESKFKQK